MKSYSELSSKEIKKLEYLCEIVYLKELVNSLPDRLNHLIGENASFISGGQAQKIGIARALYKESPLLILDEATNAIDSKTELLILKNIKEKYKESSIIMVSHNNETLFLCDRVVYLNE